MRLIAAAATVVCFAFIAYLFRREWTRAPRQSISWAPFVWMFIAGSRFVSSWLNLRGTGGVEGYSEGSPLDRAVFLAPARAGGLVLRRHDSLPGWSASLGRLWSGRGRVVNDTGFLYTNPRPVLASASRAQQAMTARSFQ